MEMPPVSNVVAKSLSGVKCSSSFSRCLCTRFSRQQNARNNSCLDSHPLSNRSYKQMSLGLKAKWPFYEFMICTSPDGGNSQSPHTLPQLILSCTNTTKQTVQDLLLQQIMQNTQSIWTCRIHFLRSSVGHLWAWFTRACIQGKCRKAKIASSPYKNTYSNKYYLRGKNVWRMKEFLRPRTKIKGK